MKKIYYSKEGILIGTADVPEGYSAEGELRSHWQSEMQPFSAVMQSSSPDGTIAMCITNKDVRYDLRNPLLRGIGLLVAEHTEEGYEKFTSWQDYLQNWAVRRTGLELYNAEEISHSGSDEPAPSAFLTNEKNRYDRFLEISSTPVSADWGSRLCRFDCTAGGLPAVVLAGMDYFTADLAYSFLGGIEMPESISNAIETAKERLGIDSASISETVSTAKETLKEMTLSDYMHGGLIGKMRRDKKNRQASEPAGTTVSAPKQETAKKPEKRGDLTVFGARRRYLCLCLKEKEQEARDAFADFIRSGVFDSSLDQREAMEVDQKMERIRSQAAMNQSIALQKQAQLQQMQRKTSQMIADNARHASDGLMDSWKRKMDSESRISRGFSEAIRGVDTYQNSYGQDVEVSTAADHVYENRYGDVFGVSGSAPDQETLNELNWQELNKKQQ